MFGPLFLVGVPAPVLFWYVLPNTCLGLFDHSNVDVELGWLGYVFTAPRAHRIHHSLDMKEGNSNFGSALVVWDILFGTFIYTQNEVSTYEVGIQVTVSEIKS